MAVCEAEVAQSQKGNAPPEKSVFEFMQKIARSHDFVKKFKIDVSNFREKKNCYERKLYLILKLYQRVKLMRRTTALNTNKLY